MCLLFCFNNVPYEDFVFGLAFSFELIKLQKFKIYNNWLKPKFIS